MAVRRRTRFAQGFAVGVGSALAGGIALLYGLSMLDLVGFTVIRVPEVQRLLAWTYRNLGLSLIPFALTLALFVLGLRRLMRAVAARGPLPEVVQAEHWVDIWISLFFGIGVVWTAIGMRGALVEALAEPQQAAVDGAFALLERLVDGGILIALSTTIFGGVGGYLMRVAKAVAVGGALRRYYVSAAEAQGVEINRQLAAIESHLARIGEPQPGTNNGPSVLVGP